MSDYTIFGKTEDGSRQRVFYTIEVVQNKYVDVMCIRNDSENYEYLMQNGDGSYVYCKGEDTYPGYPLDERKCVNYSAIELPSFRQKTPRGISWFLLIPTYAGDILWDDCNHPAP